MSRPGWTIRLWSCHYERSEESAFAGAGTAATETADPSWPELHPNKRKRHARWEPPGSAVRDNNSKSRSRTLRMQHSFPEKALRCRSQVNRRVANGAPGEPHVFLPQIVSAEFYRCIRGT